MTRSVRLFEWKRHVFRDYAFPSNYTICSSGQTHMSLYFVTPPSFKTDGEDEGGTKLRKEQKIRRV
jgi:hypothetical protein